MEKRASLKDVRAGEQLLQVKKLIIEGSMKESIKIYTDGSARGNPGPGGYGVVMLWGGKRKEMSGGFRLTTNNRMELLAVIKALQSLKRSDLPIEIYTDSKYVCEAINQGWLQGWQRTGFKGKKNVDLWKQLIPLLQQYKPKFLWVRGHNGHVLNERCDALATEAADGKDLDTDLIFEESRNGEGSLL